MRITGHWLSSSWVDVPVLLRGIDAGGLVLEPRAQVFLNVSLNIAEGGS